MLDKNQVCKGLRETMTGLSDVDYVLMLNKIVPNWHEDKAFVINIELVFRPLSDPVAGLIEDHHALVFSFGDGDYLTAEYDDIGINLLYTKKQDQKSEFMRI